MTVLLIFDLDGTLIDSSQDLALSMNATREHMGLSPLDPTLILSYVGNGASVLVQRAMGPEASDADVESALEFFLQFYSSHAVAHTELYPGIAETVAKLSNEGHTLAVLTNKPHAISLEILTALQIQTRFRRVMGGDTFAAKKPDPIGIVSLMDELRVGARDTAMIGDSSVDVQTARHAGVPAWGVAWGFQPQSFQAHPPDVLIRRVDDLLTAVASHQFVPTSE